ncbi:hypothetical protein KP509_14G010000 [Ceratopteris richardii]|uniref:EF-hand domain-containing protein n=1 Tax=Ceratopteris richardii TaxID=49495 RepID=A0A8T2T9D6_CERRI|nr:hypothetical protein KP509_14G010000 [Ceratopteris richardii]KAH7414765.1 hypothetical protein KP509_14G010000 [Ceratopteris richardii]
MASVEEHFPVLRMQKVAKIFNKFDVNGDGHLNREEMSNMVVAVNPTVQFSEEQISAILNEVFCTYRDYIEDRKGLSLQGFFKTYEDGAGDVDRDFDALNLEGIKETSEEEDDDGISTLEGTSQASSLPSKRSGISFSLADDKDGTTSTSRRKRSVGSWSASPKNGIAYDDTWKLVEDLEIIVRRIEMKLDAKNRKSKGNNVSSAIRTTFRLSRDFDTEFDAPSVEPSTIRRPWEETSVDYLNFQRSLCEIRERADISCTREEAFDAHMAIGRSLFEHKLYKEALVSFKRALELKPADVRAHFQSGNTLYTLGRISEAKEAYVSALDTAEVFSSQWASLVPQIHVNLGIALEGEGMLLGASEHYKEAAIRETKHYRAWKHLGSALYGVGEYRAAKKALTEAIFLNPDYADAHCDLGSTLHALGDHEDAVKEFQKAIELKQDHIEALFNLATLLKDTGKFQRACDMYTRVLKLQNNNWHAKLNLAVSFLGAGHIDEAKKAFKEAYKMTKRSDLNNAITHLRQMDKRTRGLSSFLKRGEENDGAVGDSFRAEDNSITVEASRFRRANASTTPREWLACALEIRNFQRCTRLNKCDLASIKKEINQSVLPVSSSGVGLTEKSIRKEALERVMRRLLYYLKPEAFQAAMKAVNEKVLRLLDTSDSGRVDLGMMFAVLAPVCGGPVEKRKRTVFDALVWRSSRNNGGEIGKGDANLYFNILRSAYLVTPQEQDDLMEINPEEEPDTSISYPEFVELFEDSEWGFGILNVLARLEVEDQVRHRCLTCSVCSYAIIGPYFKEVRANFSLCAFCYSSGKVPLVARKEEYYFKEYNSEVRSVKEKLKLFKSRALFSHTY